MLLECHHYKQRYFTSQLLTLNTQSVLARYIPNVAKEEYMTSV